jgi:hypothetical protein
MVFKKNYQAVIISILIILTTNLSLAQNRVGSFQITKPSTKESNQFLIELRKKVKIKIDSNGNCYNIILESHPDSIFFKYKNCFSDIKCLSFMLDTFCRNTYNSRDNLTQSVLIIVQYENLYYFYGTLYDLKNQLSNVFISYPTNSQPIPISFGTEQNDSKHIEKVKAIKKRKKYKKKAKKLK